MEGLSDSERRRAQNRENLRAHYGLARANTSSLSPLSESVKRPDTPRDTHVEQSKAQVTKEDPLDLGRQAWTNSIRPSANAVHLDIPADSPGFSPQQYYAKLVTTASLPDLIRQSTTLINGELCCRSRSERARAEQHSTGQTQRT